MLLIIVGWHSCEECKISTKKTCNSGVTIFLMALINVCYASWAYLMFIHQFWLVYNRQACKWCVAVVYTSFIHFFFYILWRKKKKKEKKPHPMDIGYAIQKSNIRFQTCTGQLKIILISAVLLRSIEQTY